MRIIGALTCALVLGIASYFWPSDALRAANKEALLFHPSVGDVRYFAVDQTTEIGVSGRPGTVNRMTSVLRSEVLDADDGVVELQSGAVKAVERMRGRTLVDTESGGQRSGNEKLLADFLQSGVIEQVNIHGVPIDSSYQNQGALKSTSDRPEVLQTILLRSLSVFSWYSGQFPSEDLALGLSWQIGNQQLGDATVQGMQFEVTHLDSQTVTLEFEPVDPRDRSADADSTANTFKVAGYLELERQTGWPRQANVQVSAEEDYQETTFQIVSNLNVRQTGVDPGLDTERLLSMAKMSLRSRPVDTSSPIFNDYFMPPFSPLPVEESLAKIQRTLLWFGTEPLDYGYGRGEGVESQLNSSNLQNATIHAVTGVRLLDTDGEPVAENLLPNPDFRLLKPSIGGQTGNARIPFLRQELTDSQLASIGAIELDAQVSTPGESHSASFEQSDKAIELKGTGLKLVAEDWGSQIVRIRVSETGGIPPGALPRVMGYPVDEAGKPLPQFGLRMTHSAFESVLGAMQASHGGEKAMAKALMQGLAAMPPYERNGDFIFEFTRTGAHPLERFKFEYVTTRTEDVTFTAPAARETIAGGTVLGERTMYRGNVPRFNLKSRNSQASSYRMTRISLPVEATDEKAPFEQVARGELKISEEQQEALIKVQSMFDLKHLPLVAYNKEGEALVPLWNDLNSGQFEKLKAGGLVLRFWGDIESVDYPTEVD